MRTINEHKVNPANDRISITVVDEPGAGGANHEYHVSWDAALPNGGVTLSFQNGPIAEVGVNGITQDSCSPSAPIGSAPFRLARMPAVRMHSR